MRARARARAHTICIYIQYIRSVQKFLPIFCNFFYYIKN